MFSCIVLQTHSSHTDMKRIGFACKWIDTPEQVNGLKPKDAARVYNTGTTTVSWLNRQTRQVAEERLWDLMRQNIESTRRLVERVGTLPHELRMVRLSSDILPVYTESSWSYFYKLPDVQAYAARHFAQIGTIARSQDVRLSFHPGQFCVLASSDADIVERSIEEFEYHADMARWMGYGSTFQDFKINVHISGHAGPEGIRMVYGRLSPEARNTLTIENEEISYGLDDCLSISDLVPVVLDIHHHFCREGDYIQATDDRIKMVTESWCRDGVDRRPVIHYSQSREEHLADHPINCLPSRNALIESGINKQKMRAHSDFMWNTAVNEWAFQHWNWADCMVEAKGKNLASHSLYEFWKSLEK